MLVIFLKCLGAREDRNARILNIYVDSVSKGVTM